MSSLGMKIDQFDTPVCNSFKAKILNDQLCYEVDVKDILDKNKISEELDLGLTLILDNNIDRQIGLVKHSGKETFLQKLGK